MGMCTAVERTGCGMKFTVHGSRFTGVEQGPRGPLAAPRDASSSAFSLQLSALFLLLLFVLTACHGYPPPGKKAPPKPWETLQNAASPDQVKWTYLPGGLTLNIKAEKDLNLFERFSHNILLCT